MANTPEYTRKAVDNYRKKFDIMQLRLPKGTRDRIEKQADKAHDFVVDCVLAELERLEAQAEPTGQQETYQTKQQEEIVKEQPKHEMKSNNNVYKKPMTLDDVQAIIDKKKAEQKEREEMLEKARQERIEQEEAKEREEMRKIIDRIISGEDDDEDSNKWIHR